MGEEPIGDQIIRALAVIKELQDTVKKHDQLLTKIIDGVTRIEKRLTAVEKAKRA